MCNCCSSIKREQSPWWKGRYIILRSEENAVGQMIAVPWHWPTCSLLPYLHRSPLSWRALTAFLLKVEFQWLSKPWVWGGDGLLKQYQMEILLKSIEVTTILYVLDILKCCITTFLVPSVGRFYYLKLL